MIRPCPNKINCDQSLLLNYSAETIDRPSFWRRLYSANGCVEVCESYVSQEEADLCAQRQLVLCDENGGPGDPDDPTTTLYPNDPQECTIACPDGRSFTYLVPAGTFEAASLAEANAQAHSYACRQAELKRICLGNITRCCCAGVAFDAEVTLTGESRLLTFAVASGTLPPGLAIVPNPDNYLLFNLQGTPTTAGNYTFGISATDENGNHADGVYECSVIEVGSTALPDFTIGQPYSHQMTVVGGSGEYAWRVAAGTLPAGLSMSLSGLIHGTPTAGTSGNLMFECIDLACEKTDKTFFPPSVSLLTTSTTRVATVIGYPEFPGHASTPPRKYKKLTWSGESHQWGDVISTGEDCGKAKYVWEGVSEINYNGAQLSLYTKNLYASCPEETKWPRWYANGNPLINVGTDQFIGYCWPDDPESCPVCLDPPEFSKDVAGNYVGDWSNFAKGNSPTFSDSTHFQVHLVGDEPTTNYKGEWSSATHYIAGDWVKRNNFYYQALRGNGPMEPESYPDRWTPVGAQPADFLGEWDSSIHYEQGQGVSRLGIYYVSAAESGPVEPETHPDDWKMQAGFRLPGNLQLPATANFPTSIFNDLSNWIWLSASHYFDGLLEDEYTDAQAYANAYVFTSNGNTNENSPRTIGFVSRYTSVTYRLICANLVVGEEYTVRVQRYNTKTGASDVRTYTFTAIADTHIISDTLPTPNVGQPLQVKSPSISYAA